MRSSVGQRKLAAEYFANVGVAWFVAGIITPFVGESRNLVETSKSIGWGAVLSAIFLFTGYRILKDVKS